jgi:hypothetical protein
MKAGASTEKAYPRPEPRVKGALHSYVAFVYSTCLHCTRDLGRNDVFETLPIGRRVAFDPAKGRLWVVCRSCAKWNLVPFDTRLETIDACERVFRDTRTRFSTDHVGLARARDGMDLVRIGAPQRPEFASWRYGAQYKRRRLQTIAMAGTGAAAGVMLVVGMRSIGLVSAGMVSALIGQLPRVGWNAVRDARRRVLVSAQNLGRPVKLQDSHLKSAHIDLSGREMRLQFNRPPGFDSKPGLATIAGPEARLIMRRVTAALNDTTGSSRQLTGAVSRLEAVQMEEWLRQAANEAVVTKGANKAPLQRWEGFASPALRLATLPASDRLAVEMWLSEEDEAKALAGELALLERQWKAAEELARIADSLTLSSP